MADWWGRKLPIAVGCLLMIVGGLVGTFAKSYGSMCVPLHIDAIEEYQIMIEANTTLVYVGGRFVLGFGNSFAQMASPLLLTEICHPQHRGKVTTMYNCLWGLGAVCKNPFY